MTAAEFAMLISASLGAITALLIGAWQARSTATKDQLATVDNLVKLHVAEIERLQRKIKDLEDQYDNERTELLARIEALEAELAESISSLNQVRAWAELLVDQLNKNGIKPISMPRKEITRPHRRDVNHDRGGSK